MSSLGHFLKGSSAALGLTKVKDSCECMQHYGAKKNADGSGSIEAAVALEKIQETLTRVKEEYIEAEAYLKKCVPIARQLSTSLTRLDSTEKVHELVKRIFFFNPSFFFFGQKSLTFCASRS